MVKEPARRDTGHIANASVGGDPKSGARANGDAVIEVDDGGGVDECIDGHDEAPLNRPHKVQAKQMDGSGEDTTGSKTVL